MKSVVRTSLLAFCIALVSGFVLAAIPSAPVTLDVGPALADGTAVFILNSADGMSSLPVQVSLAAGDSPSAVAAKIVLAVNLSYGWTAQASGGAVTFSRFDGMSWSSVPSVSGLTNTSGALMYLSADGSTGAQYGNILLSLNAPASGRAIGQSGPAGSSVTFRINGIVAPLVISLAAGQTSTSILSAIAAYLNAGMGSSGSYTLANSSTLAIYLNTYHAAFNFQTNDSGLQGAVALAEVASGVGTGGSGGTDKGGDHHNPPAQ